MSDKVLIRQKATSKLVDELLAILRIDTGEETTGTPITTLATPPPPNDAWSQNKLMMGIGARLNGVFKDNPKNANEAEAKLLDAARAQLTVEHRKIELGTIKSRDDTAMASLKTLATDTAKTFNEVTASIDAREQMRTDLRGRLLLQVPDGAKAVADATDAENDDLVERRKKVEEKVNGAKTLEELTKIDGSFGQFTKLVREVETKAAERMQRMETTLEAARAVQDPADAKKDALKPQRDAVANAFVKPPIEDKALLAGETALATLRTTQGTLEASIVPLRKRRVVYESQLAGLENDLKPYAAALGKKRSAIDSEFTDCRKLLASPLDEAKLNNFDKQVVFLKMSVDSTMKSNIGNPAAVDEARKYIQAEARKLHDEAQTIPDRTTLITSLKATMTKQYKTFGSQIKSGSGGGSAVARAVKEVEPLRQTLDDLRVEAGAALVLLVSARNKLLADITASDPKGCATEYATKLAALRQSVTLTLGGMLTDTAVDTATEQVDQFAALLAEAAADATADADVAAAQKDLAANFAGVRDKARGPVQKELQRAYDTAQARASLSGDQRDMVGSAKLFDALQKRIATIKSEKPLPATAFTGITVDNKPVTDAVQKEVDALCGETLFGKLNPAGKTALCEAVAANGKAMMELLVDGLGGNPDVFGAMVLEAGGKGLDELAKAFTGTDAATARAGLLDLMDKGGMAAHPRALASMLKHGVDDAAGDKKDEMRTKNAASLAALAGKGAAPETQSAMRTMLADCGLGTSPNATAAPAIGSLLQDGFGGDADKLVAFGQGYQGNGKAAKESRANLKNLIQKGGVGEHPNVLGPLVKTSGADKLKEIGAEFSPKANAEALKAILDRGGMSGDTKAPGKQHEHKDTLAKVFQDGLDGNAKGLVTFMKTFKDHADESKTMLDSWNEWDDKYEAQRQPGDKVKRLLDKNKFDGKIELLQKKFTTSLKTVGDPRRKKQAIRLAPHFCTETASDKSVNLQNGISKITASVEKRHKPETFDRSKMGTAALHSQFPPDTDVAAVLGGAVQALGGVTDKSQAYQVDVGDLRVEFGFLNDSTVNHLGPRTKPLPDDPHPMDAPEFTTDDINKILTGIGK